MEVLSRIIALSLLFGGSYVYKNYTVVNQKYLNHLEHIKADNGNRYTMEQEYAILNCCVSSQGYANKQRCFCALERTQKYYSFYDIKNCSSSAFMNYYQYC